MKTSQYLKLVLLLVLFYSFAPAQYPQMDFPLQIGNVWRYSAVPENYSDSRAIKDTLMQNGLIYTQIDGGFIGGFFRKEGARVYSHDAYTDTETLLYDFSKVVGDTILIQTNGIDTTYTIVYEEATLNIFGHPRHYMSFLEKHSHSTMYGIRQITDGLGFTAYNGEVSSFGLTGAVINGTQYGDVVRINIQNTLPMSHRILQNYPNPFNPETNISFELVRPEKVTIDIFDQLGRQITTLVSGKMSAGLHAVKWNAQNMPSGVYHYRISTGSQIETKSMMLLK